MSFCFSYNGEDYEGDHNTREEAFSEAVSELSSRFERGHYTTIYTAQAVDYDATFFAPDGGDLASMVLEHMQEQAAGEVGWEYTEEFPEHTNGSLQVLGQQLEAVVRDWVKAHVQKPRFHGVDLIEEHDIPEEPEDELA